MADARRPAVVHLPRSLVALFPGAPLRIEAEGATVIMIRAGYIALRRIATFFKVQYDPDPQPSDTTSIERARFENALDVLEGAGVPLVADRDQAWLDFNGWRVNYDRPLRALEQLPMAPTPWWERPMQSAWATDEPDIRIAPGEVGG